MPVVFEKTQKEPPEKLFDGLLGFKGIIKRP